MHCGVSLEVNPKELVGLFGGSGTGKSVLIRSLIGLDTPDKGDIYFEGKKIFGSEVPPKKEKDWIHIRTKIGFVFQNGALFDSLSVYENLAYPLRAHTRLDEEQIKKKVQTMLKSVDMEGTDDLLPNQLSGGMQKRAGLARATILEPECILFDEPTAGLDPINTRRFIENIRRLKKTGISGIFITHDIPSALEVCDKIAFLNKGVIHAFLTVEEVKHSSDPFIQSFIQGAHIR